MQQQPFLLSFSDPSILALIQQLPSSPFPLMKTTYADVREDEKVSRYKAFTHSCLLMLPSGCARSSIPKVRLFQT